MPPRTRRSRAKVPADHASVAGENPDTMPATNHLKTIQKRTLSSIETNTADPAIPASEATIEPPPKKGRKAGPAHGRPMKLVLIPEGGGGDPQGPPDDNNGNDRNMGPALKRTSSYYPGRGDTHTFTNDSSRFDLDTSHFDVSDNSDVESERDWLDEPQVTEPARRHPSKMSEAAVIERPSWQAPTIHTPGATTSASVGSPTQPEADDVDAGSNNDAIDTPLTPLNNTTWPADTDIISSPGSNKLTLTVQHPHVRLVVGSSFENLRASLLFDNAFPDASSSPRLIQAALIRAAESHGQRTTYIHSRLLHDVEYLAKLSYLPRGRIPHFRKEVKERCVTIIRAAFLSIGSAQTVVNVVDKQLSNYNYTFPSASRRNALSEHPLLMRTRPYRNDRIITVIRDLYFTGGVKSFAHRFNHRFPTFQGRDGVTRRGVPVPMVALVATALYAAIQEWRKGTQEVVEFSMNAYLDVYQGHVETFNFIKGGRIDTYNTILGDIYSQASAEMMTIPAAAPIAELDLEELEA